MKKITIGRGCSHNFLWAHKGIGAFMKKEVHMKKGYLIFITTFALMTGFYGLAGAQMATKQDAINMVEKAGKLIEEKGDAALAEISDPRGQFIDRKKELYVFVHDENAVVLAHPYQHDLIGQSMKGKTDDQGRKFHDEIVSKALTKGSGWTEYSYQKPTDSSWEGGDTHQVKYNKITYGKLFKHGTKKYIVSSGTYE